MADPNAMNNLAKELEIRYALFVYYVLNLLIRPFLWLTRLWNVFGSQSKNVFFGFDFLLIKPDRKLCTILFF